MLHLITSTTTSTNNSSSTSNSMNSFCYVNMYD